MTKLSIGFPMSLHIVMNSIKYIKNLRRWMIGVVLFSFFAGVSTVLTLDPTINYLYIFGFLLILLLFLTSSISVVALWWFFDERRRLLTISQINQIVYQSLITSTVVVCVLVMNQTGQLSLASGILVLGCYLLYQLWANSN